MSAFNNPSLGIFSTVRASIKLDSKWIRNVCMGEREISEVKWNIMWQEQ